MIRNRFALIWTLLCVVQLASLFPAQADDRSTCAQRGSEGRIAACSNLIAQSGGRDAWAFDNRGAEYGDRGDLDRAIADFTEAIRLDPKLDNVYRHRGLALVRKNEYGRAIPDQTEALRQNPADVDAYNERGMSYAATGNADRALRDFNEAVRINPRFKFAYNNRGLLYHTRGDDDRAIADYSEAIRLDPGYAVAYLNRGDIHRQRSQCDRALPDYDEAIRIDPSLTDALTARGLCYEQIKEIAKARADFNAAVALPPKYTSRSAQEIARKRLAALPGVPTATAPSTNAPAVVAATTPVDKVTDQPDQRGRRVALVIGNSAYDNVPVLTNPVPDATLVADTLKRTGFDAVSLVTNLRKEALVQALRTFAAQAETADWAVIYYAGHGVEIGGVNYLVPTDAKIASDRDIGFEAVPLDQVINVAERARRLRLVILDACRNNPFAGQMKRTLAGATRSVSRGLAAIEPEAGTLVVYAAKDGETALDGDGANSPFASAFVANVVKPGLEVRRLFDYVRDDVMDATNGRQKPFSYGSISGRQDFFFVAAK
ncbi:tetratricopeptide repeat protein [Bradyrhizobium sp. INPA01-394B]|uniref:Tetratricopeptide repeat protein n=1 Tax=Bradyrhizobium campsiandrae TaxID=1729892 RepID=A0ABR7U210_9BRAD|nr:caspase family protein [Bradyrhizobium campsiandrae]MBC9883152.1 tetratricopeptide repeat protein [Bradyrhizobium campsiandrae]MBC9977432.1 tetratricopeptide repeat protein [Bradyrhizobium campsiandrae]